jgi:energy-coupling factor transporter ATP-binding protein EcfA2
MCIWIYGETGEGKSQLAMVMCGLDRYRRVGEIQWFDGYIGQENVTFDDFRKGKLDWSVLLAITDHYPVDDLAVKGSFTAWRAKQIVFTCPRGPADEYAWKDKEGTSHKKEDVEQLVRRMDIIVHAVHGGYIIEKGAEYFINGNINKDEVMKRYYEMVPKTENTSRPKFNMQSPSTEEPAQADAPREHSE